MLNERFKAPMHKVMLKGDKKRFVFVLFSVPKEDTLIKAPSELVGEEDHPLHYKSFKYEEFMNFIKEIDTKEGALEDLQDFNVSHFN